MVWIDDILEFLFVNTVNACGVFIIWKLCSIVMRKLHAYYFIYYSIRFCLFFYIFPFIQAVYYLNYYVGDDAWGNFTELSYKVPFEVIEILFIVWVTGVFVLCVKRLKQMIYFEKIIRNNAYVDEDDPISEIVREKLKGRKKVKVCRNFLLQSPAVYGIRAPVLIFPEKKYQKNEIELIVQHEILHIKNHDLLIKYLFMFLEIIYWFNPIIRLCRNENDLWSEVICDYDVYRSTYRKFKKSEYAQLLLKISEDMHHNKYDALEFFSKNKNVLQRRIIYMKNFKIKAYKVWATITAVSFVGLSSLSVYAADSGIIAYKSAHTQYVYIEETDDRQDREILEEKRMSSDEITSEIKEQPMDMTRALNSATWNIAAHTMYKTPGVYLEQGDVISIVGKVNTSGYSARFGIVYPDGSTRYVYGSRVNHGFNITTSGNYRVFVENTSSSKINVDVSYVD